MGLVLVVGGLFLFERAHELGWLGIWLPLGVLGLLVAFFFDRIFPGLLQRASVRRTVYSGLGQVLDQSWSCENCLSENAFGVDRCSRCDRRAPDQSWSCGVCQHANSLDDPLCMECSVRRPFDDGSY